MDIAVNILIGAGVFACITLAVVKIIKDKRAGKSSCGAGCGGCTKCNDKIKIE